MGYKAGMMLAMVFVLGCQNKGGQAGHQAPLPKNQDVMDLSRFSGETLEFEKNKEIFSFGCTEEGISASNGQVDPGLRVGDVEYTENRNSSDGFVIKTLQKNTVAEAESRTLKYQTTFLSIEKEKGLELLRKTFSFGNSCWSENEEGFESSQCRTDEDPENLLKTMKSNMNSNGQRVFDQSKSSNWDCRIEQPISYTSEEKVGSFKLKDGTSIRATMSIFKNSGIILCGKKNLGMGESISVDIRSNEVLSLSSLNYCGGVRVMNAHTIKLKDDRVVTSSQEEITTAKLR